jgi:lipopolysaccharide transport system permease protein
MTALLKSINERRELLQLLVIRNLKIRYKNTSLGFFWSLLSPLFLIVIYSVFLKLLKLQMPIPVLVTGIITWQFLAMCLGDSLNAIIGNSNLVTKTAFPRIILPLAMVKANLINFLLSFVVLFVYLLIAGVDIGPLYYLPIIMITQFALCLGVALLVSCSNVYFRDTEHMLSMVMLAWFFMSPAIYDLKFIWEKLATMPEWVQTLVFLNPMFGILNSYRVCLLSSFSPGIGYIAISFAVAWAVLFIGIAVFQKLEPGFGDEL